MIGKIQIELEGIGIAELERCRQMIHLMFQQGIFTVRNGKVILNFDSDGVLQQIDFNVSKWRRNKDSVRNSEIYEEAIIAIAK